VPATTSLFQSRRAHCSSLKPATAKAAYRFRCGMDN
jgi:hypothetical protein